jgi:hypothetical protein
MCLVGFRVSVDAEAARRNGRAAGKHPEGLLGLPMKARVMRILLTLGTIAATALAGGATLKGF